MPSRTVVWCRETNSFLGAPLILFPTSGDADAYITRLKSQDVKKGGKSAGPLTYDKLTVTTASAT